MIEWWRRQRADWNSAAMQLQMSWLVCCWFCCCHHRRRHRHQRHQMKQKGLNTAPGCHWGPGSSQAFSRRLSWKGQHLLGSSCSSWGGRCGRDWWMHLGFFLIVCCFGGTGSWGWGAGSMKKGWCLSSRSSRGEAPAASSAARVPRAGKRTWDCCPSRNIASCGGWWGLWGMHHAICCCWVLKKLETGGDWWCPGWFQWGDSSWGRASGGSEARLLRKGLALWACCSSGQGLQGFQDCLALMGLRPWAHCSSGRGARGRWRRRSRSGLAPLAGSGTMWGFGGTLEWRFEVGLCQWVQSLISGWAAGEGRQGGARSEGLWFGSGRWWSIGRWRSRRDSGGGRFLVGMWQRPYKMDWERCRGRGGWRGRGCRGSSACTRSPASPSQAGRGSGKQLSSPGRPRGSPWSCTRFRARDGSCCWKVWCCQMPRIVDWWRRWIAAECEEGKGMERAFFSGFFCVLSLLLIG